MEIVKVIQILKKESKTFDKTAFMSTPKSPFQVLISCIISLRTRDEVTGEVSKKLFAVAPTARKLAKLDVKRIERLIYPCGFYKTKAKRIKEISKYVEKHNVPKTMEGLLSLKGVGRKTANIVLVYGHGKKYHIPVDIHVHRIPNRLGWIKTKTPEETEKELERVIPKRYWQDFNNLFVSFGQNICKPIGPKCGQCPVNRYCKYEKKSH